MSENLFGLDNIPAPTAPPPAPEAPITGEQVEMFEEWEKQGLPALFEPAQLKGTGK